MEDIIASQSLINTKKAWKTFNKSTTTIYEDIITAEESQILLADIKEYTKKRRFEKKEHWDSVIVNYKEVELLNVSRESQSIIDRIHSLLSSNHLKYKKNLVFLPCHAIELKKEGYLKAHIDSVKFSGDIVAGLSLGSDSIMRLLKREGSKSDIETNTKLESQVDLLLKQFSLYVLSGESRYEYTHELLDGTNIFEFDQNENTAKKGESVSVSRKDRTSVIFRDTKD